MENNLSCLSGILGHYGERFKVDKYLKCENFLSVRTKDQFLFEVSGLRLGTERRRAIALLEREPFKVRNMMFQVPMGGQSLSRCVL